MNGKRNQRHVKLQSGFTIVELLIVIVVIAVLASITVVAYNGISNRAHKAAIETDLRNTKQRLEIYKATLGVYPTSTAQLGEANISASKGSYDVGGTSGGYANFYYCVTLTGDVFAVGARAKGSNQSYLISSSNGTTTTSTQLNGTSTCTEGNIPNPRFVTQGLSGSTHTWADWVK